jgi:hypothetical protein
MWYRNGRTPKSALFAGTGSASQTKCRNSVPPISQQFGGGTQTTQPGDKIASTAHDASATIAEHDAG